MPPDFSRMYLIAQRLGRFRLEYAAPFSSGCSYCLCNTLTTACALTFLHHHVHVAAPQVRHPRRWLRSQLVLKQPRPLHADGQRQSRHGHRLLCEIPPLYLRPCRLKPCKSPPGAMLKLRNRLHRCSLELAKTASEGCKTEGSAAAGTGCSTSRSALSNIAEGKQSENIGLLQRVHEKIETNIRN
jgi:hypothetical protein